jgi:uncharacterized membrane protein (UPF0182 family)
LRRTIYITIFAVVAAILILIFTATMITDWFWFGEVGYQSVFLTSLLSSLGLRIITGIFLFLIIYINLRITRRSLHTEPEIYEEDENVIPIRRYVADRIFDAKKLNILFLAVSILLALLFSSAASNNWLMVQQFLNKASFGIKEPIFNLDASFYIFTLPFLRMLYSFLFTGILLSIFAAGAAYFLFGAREFLNWRDNQINQPKVHLSILLALLFLLKAFDYILDGYGLLNKPGGVVYGPGYTDVNVLLLAYRVLAVIAVAAAVAVLINIFLKKFRYVIYTVISLIVVSILLGNVAPYAVQKIRVEPNELAVESPYIENNMELTRKAYNIDQIRLETFEASTLDMADIQENPGTIQNIRLWDPEPLQNANTQLQEIRPYYSFLDVDIDRYTINGELRQVMISARELSKNQLDQNAQTWVNQKLRYTHGYGLTMNYVASATSEGHPHYVVKDIPPESEDIAVEVPQIYFGQAPDDYVIVNTTTEEFDYPSTTGNVSTTYTGKGGIPVSNIFTRALFALRFGDYRMLISNALTDDSRIIFRTNISERIQRIAPFLVYDRDPYLVVDDGRLFWIQDAYTTSRSFPYSTPVGGMGNYIRNSVKVVVDAYNGDVTYYADLENDPIVRSYAGIFPKLFKPWEQIPDGLVPHLRYPEDLFNVQAEIYKTYHMEDVRDFYNKEDVWTIPQETFAGETITMQPYYTIMTLPGEEENPEFVLMLPFTPAKKNNMAAWLAVRCDPEHYGDAIVFQFSKQELVYGPTQVEAEIQADSEISQAISLWSQRGSEVIRGNLLVIPISDGIIYVEPLFLQSEQNKLPSLKRVIVFHNGELAWAETLGEALAKLFAAGDTGTGLIDDGAPEGAEDGAGVEEIGDEDMAPELESLDELIERANQLFRQAKERQQSGDWAGYGEALSELESVLERMANQ